MSGGGTCCHVLEGDGDGPFVVKGAVESDEGVASGVAHHQDLLHHLLPLLDLEDVDNFERQHFVAAFSESFPNITG